MVGAANYGNASIIMAKGRAIRDRIQAAIMARYKMLDIEGDNLIVIRACKGRQRPLGKFGMSSRTYK